MRQVWLSATMVLAGTGLLVSAGYGSNTNGTKLRQGGTLRVILPVVDIDDIDPSLAYTATTWHIEYSTALKLLNYPDAPAPRGTRLVPEGASSVRVSRDGRKYTFVIRKGFRFSNGQPVTALNYEFAINRALSRGLQSPASRFIADPDRVNIVGAQDVLAGGSSTASGVRVRGNKLVVVLEKPDGTFLSKLTMPFFQALPTSLSLTRKVVQVDSGKRLPSAGPYYVSYRAGRLVTLERNRFYAGRRPRRLSRIDIRTQVPVDLSYEDVRANRADFTYSLPRDAAEQLAHDFGLRGRFRVRPRRCVSFIALNTSNPLFRNNPKLRQAVNYAIDRRRMVKESDPFTTVPTDQYLPAGTPGFKDIKAYPLSGDMAKARELAAGNVPPGGPWKYYYRSLPPGPQRMELVRASLAQIGIHIDPQSLCVSFCTVWDAAGWRNSPHAFADVTWCGDFPDPYNVINDLLYGGTIRDENNTNISYFDDPAYNTRMERAATLTGSARRRAYERLDRDLVTKAAPWAAWSQPTNQFFFSDNVDMRSFAYQPIYEAPPYNLLALK